MSGETPIFGGGAQEEQKSKQISAQAEKRLKELARSFPSRESLVLPALFIAQEELGWISEQALSWVASQVGVPLSRVKAVASFYTMFYKRPVGRYHLQICRTLSCMLLGAEEIKEWLEKHLQIKPGEVSADGMWSFEEVECLGSCGTGPVVQINDVFFERMNPEKLSLLVVRIAEEQPDLRYSTIRGGLGLGLADLPRSLIWAPDLEG